MPICGVGQITMEANKTTQLRIESMHTAFRAAITCLILPKIMSRIPQAKLCTKNIRELTGIILADPIYDQPGDIDLLIGACLYWKIIIGAPRNSLAGQPAIQNTRLGWIIGGEINEEICRNVSTCLTVTNLQLAHQLEKFWHQETFPEIQHYTKEEELGKEQFLTKWKIYVKFIKTR